MSNPVNHLYEFGRFRIDSAKRRFLRDGEVVPLPPKVFDTLLALVERSGQSVDKDELMAKVWQDVVVEENNLTQNISTLRKVLGDGNGGGQYIVTIPKQGYRFVADVKERLSEAEKSLIEDGKQSNLDLETISEKRGANKTGYPRNGG